MTIALDPNETFDLVLAEDEAKPEGERPTFVFRYLTARQFRAFEEANTEIDKLRADVDTTAGQLVDLLLGAITPHLADWRNQVNEQGQPLPFSPEDLDRVVSMADLSELVERIPDESHVSQWEKKRSAWQSRSSTGVSTKTASLENAPTPPETST